jgi:RNA polymerase sigma-70 factor (ECF subfamily)
MSLDPEGDCPFVDDSLPIEFRPCSVPRPESRAQWLERAVLPHVPLLRSYLSRKYRGIDLDDLIQTIYLRLMQTESVAHVHNAKSYLFRTAMSEISNQVRRSRVVQFEQLGPEHCEMATDEAPIEQVIDARRRLDVVTQAMAKLPRGSREVVELRRIDGLSSRATAARVGLSISSIEKKQVNALRYLQECVQRNRA